MINHAPQRIVSLVPSQSELLNHLGLIDELIGVTRFCTHPDYLRKNKEVVGGTKDPDIELIQELKPDLIVCNKEENRKEDVQFLQSTYPVYTSDVNNLAEAINMISDIGSICGKQSHSEVLIDQITSGFKSIQNVSALKVVYLIWNDPIMVVGSNNFINSMLEECGYSNLFRHRDERYLESSLLEIQNLEPDVIFLSSEPYPFKKKNQLEFEKNLRGIKAVLVDGRAFSWYGSHLAKSPAYFNSLTKSMSA